MQGHFVCHCPQSLEVRYLSLEKQEELLLQLLVAYNAAGIPSPDAPISEGVCEVPLTTGGLEVPKESF